MFADDLCVKLLSAVFDKRIHARYQCRKMHGNSCSLASAQLAVKVPKINADRQQLRPLPFGVFANVMFGGIQQARWLLASQVERVSLFQTNLDFRGSSSGLRGQRGVQLFTRRRTHRLRLAQHLARAH